MTFVIRHSSFVVAGEDWPSLFRGVVVADSPVGVRVVSVEAQTQAAHADLRPEDIILRVHGHDVRSIDGFAVLSKALKGRVVETQIVLLRGGTPRQLRLHLYSYPVLAAWGVEVVPDHDIRFAQAQTGLAYWKRMGRGFEEARRESEALAAYFNALHNVPTDFDSAFKAVELSARVGQSQMREDRVAEGVRSLHRSMRMLERLFDYPLDEPQLRRVKDELEGTLEALREAVRRVPKPSSGEPERRLTTRRTSSMLKGMTNCEWRISNWA